MSVVLVGGRVYVACDTEDQALDRLEDLGLCGVHGEIVTL